MNSNLNFEFGPVWYRPKPEPGRTGLTGNRSNRTGSHRFGEPCCLLLLRVAAACCRRPAVATLLPEYAAPPPAAGAGEDEEKCFSSISSEESASEDRIQMRGHQGSPYHWEPVRFDRLLVKPVRPGFGLGRYQTGPNSKFKFKFKKMKNSQKIPKNTSRYDESNGVKFFQKFVRLT